MNFAPALTKYTDELFGCVDYLILNEVEIEQLSPISLRRDDMDDIKRACVALIDEHPALKAVIATVGENGVIYAQRNAAAVHVPAEKVKVVDSTVSGLFKSRFFTIWLKNASIDKLHL